MSPTDKTFAHTLDPDQTIRPDWTSGLIWIQKLFDTDEFLIEIFENVNFEKNQMIKQEGPWALGRSPEKD